MPGLPGGRLAVLEDAWPSWRTHSTLGGRLALLDDAWPSWRTPGPLGGRRALLEDAWPFWRTPSPLGGRLALLEVTSRPVFKTTGISVYYQLAGSAEYCWSGFYRVLLLE